MKTSYDIESYRNTLKDVLMHFANVPVEQMDEFVNIFSLEVYNKKSIIIPPSNTHGNKFYFILKGLVRIYYMVNGKEITSDFKEEDTFFVNGYTLFTKLPNIDYHEALEDTICLVADYEAIEYLSKKYHPIEHLGRKMVEAYYAAFLKANFNKLFLSADERYDIFIKERADLVNKVSLRHIATYLGVQPETLSRLRAKKT